MDLAFAPTPTPISESALVDFTPLHAFDEANRCTSRGRQLDLVRAAAPRFREEFAATGMPEYVGTFDLVSLPYPTEYGLFRACASPSPFLIITNRLLVVRWRDREGATRTLLFEPSDAELGRNTPFFAALSRSAPAFLERFAFHQHGTVLGHLKRLGIRPEEVDYLCFDHLHTQDVRRLIGTRRPAADLSPGGPVTPMFPRARLVVQRRELEALRDLHPVQRPWYQPETYGDLREERLLAIDGDVLLGPGVALVATPGHTEGNHSLVLNTASGIWACSENAVAAECLTPEHSEIWGLRRRAADRGVEVVVNGNTLETHAEQYNSVVKEKCLVDRSAKDPRFVQFFPTSELTPHWMSPGVAPTFTHGRIEHGALRGAGGAPR